MRILVTGAAGFVGPHLIRALRETIEGAHIIATARAHEVAKEQGQFVSLDVTDQEAVRSAVAGLRPDHIVHLAGIAAPSRANMDPNLTWRVHVDGTLNIARTILSTVPECTLVYVGSGMVYGSTANSVCPLDESALLAPLDEYAATKAAADLALGVLAHQGLKCVRMRPFNHTGSGQSESFFFPAIATQIARIEHGLAEPIVRVGNLDAERDYLDVRDVARAYVLAIVKAQSLVPGVIMNVASGRARRMSDVLQVLIDHSSVKISVEQDPLRLRNNEIARMQGDAGRACALLGWSPVYSFESTVGALLEDCRGRLAASR